MDYFPFESNGEKCEDVNLLSPLTLAFIGDSVFDIYIRTMLVVSKKATAHTLHNLATTYVKAQAQANAIKKIFDELSEEEQNIFKRGRNAKSQTVPKNADVTEYRYATGFEALLGYLYLKGEITRLREILDMSIEIYTNE